MSELLDDAVRELSRLPGIGRRTALRLTLHMLRMDEEEVRRMTAAIDRFRSDIKYCARCNNLSDSDVCTICSDPSRDRSVVCVVEQVGDVLSKEVILAMSTTVEGETTLFYITRRLARFPDLKVTNIARGIGFGDEIEYADELTIAHALHNRTPVSR